MGVASGAASGGAGGAFAGVPGIAIGAGIGALGAIFSSKSQKKASDYATRMQSESTNKALAASLDEQAYSRNKDTQSRTDALEQRDYDRSQRAGYLDRMQPYTEAGARAIRGASASVESQLPGSVPGSGPMVQVRSPKGTIRAVPQSHLGYYLQKGAVQV